MRCSGLDWDVLTLASMYTSRAHAREYLGVLPEKNYIATLLKGTPKNAVHREAVPYRRLTQPKTIQGGQMKDYQLTGLSFLAWNFENGQNCILADE
jgi:SWI/SNF-related matrix-associated actin-dependent regulator of chromatin subfamily A member 5